MKPTIVGVDIGGTKLRIGLVDETGEGDALEQRPQGDILFGNSAENLCRFIDEYLRRHGAEQNAAGVCVGLPAVLDAAREVVLNAPNIAGLNGVNVGRQLARHFRVPVFLDRDVSMLFEYDCKRLGLDLSGIVLAYYVGTGLGNVVAIDGRPITGNHGAAGELGHIPAWDSNIACSCGNTGCAEELVGGKYLERLQKERFPGTGIRTLFAEHADAPELADYVAHLALPIAAEINILDPEIVVLGGGVLSLPGFPMEALRQRILEHARKPLPFERLRFAFSGAADENGVIGAGLLAWRQIKRRNAG